MKWKSIAGIILVVLSVAAMYFWETKGRDSFLLMPVLAAAKDIDANKEAIRERVTAICKKYPLYE